MKFYKHWARGEATVQGAGSPWKIRAYDGSDDTMDEALRRAKERAERAAAAVEQGRALNTYDYSDRPLREEIIQEINDAAGQAAVITRNSYGALVLNTNRVMFIDVDVYPLSNGVGRYLGEVLGNLWNGLKGKKSFATLFGKQRILSRIEEVGKSQPGLGFRAYRTAGGFRLLVTSDTYDPLSQPSNELLAAFGSDPLYVRMCKAQECYRARLSAKFWRCGARRPPSRFPWETADEENGYRKWEEEYHRQANKYATCELVGSYGDSSVHDAVLPILETHDRLTMQAGAPLA